ncbi:10585_t:CDS:2, partial [Racocetra fulgida]
NDNMLLPLFGITQHPKTLEYMIVTSYAEGGSLKNNLQYIRKLSWKERLEILRDIVSGLASLHQADLLHRNLHSGNVFLFKNYTMVGDLGLPQPVGCYTSNHEKFYDFLPYIAPEVLREYFDDNIKDIEDKNIQLPIMQFQHADKIIRAQSKHSSTSSNFYAPYYTNFNNFSSYKSSSSTTYDNKKDQS